MMTVTDTGEGMDKRTVSRIFEPFFTTKELGKGAGLGLATVYGIVSQSGGQISVESELGHGTVFTVLLPRMQDAGPPAASDQRSVNALGGSETILLVEDEPMVRSVARQILHRLGYNVLEATDQHQALQIAEHYPSPIHLLITDIVMPGMNGRELAERMQLIRADMKVLFMSGHTEDAVVRHGVSVQAKAFLQKPFSADTLARKTQEVLKTL
jgi:two-component system cell cycle sensor histidine kinase/response regulator CckA